MLPSIRFDSEFVCGVWGVEWKTRHEEQSGVLCIQSLSENGIFLKKKKHNKT